MNLKLELFNFRKSLTIDEMEVSAIVESQMNRCDEHSELEVIGALKSQLDIYTYSPKVKSLLENFDAQSTETKLVLALKDLYKKVERKNNAMLYRQPLSCIHNIILLGTQEAGVLNTISNETVMMDRIVNELGIYDWVPEVKAFMLSLEAIDEVERENLASGGGKAEKVYTCVVKTEAGHMAWVGDRWFLLGDGVITPANPADMQGEMLQQFTRLSDAMKISDCDKECVNIDISENLSLAISTKNGGLRLNGTAVEKETTLATLFESPLIPFDKKALYILCESIEKCVDCFMELDICAKVTNFLKSGVAYYVFNYMGKVYSYKIDPRYGSTFLEYETATDLINDIKREMNIDMSYFFKQQIGKETVKKTQLDDQEKVIIIKLKDVNEGIKAIEENRELLETSVPVKKAYDSLIANRFELEAKLNKVKASKIA